MIGRDESDNFTPNQPSSGYENGGSGSRPTVSETGQFPSTLDNGEYEGQDYYYEPSAQDRADFIPRKPEKSWWERLSFAAKAVVIVAPIMTLIYVFILVFILVTSTREVLATPTSATNVAATNNALRPTNTLPVLQLRSPQPSPVVNPGGAAATNPSNIPTVTPAPTPTLLPTPAPITAAATATGTASSTPTVPSTPSTRTADNTPLITTTSAVNSTATRTATASGPARTPSAATPTLAPAPTLTIGTTSSSPTTPVKSGTPTTTGTTVVVSGTPATAPTTAPNSPVTTR